MMLGRVPGRRSRMLAIGVTFVAVLGHGALAVPSATAGPVTTQVTPSVVPPATVTVAGTVAVGQTVTAQEGEWSPEGTVFAYEWRSDDVPVVGATDRGFVITPDLVGTALSVVVTGTDADGASSTLQSAAVEVGQGQLTSAVPVIARTARVGVPLTVTSGAWTPADTTLRFQWSRTGVPIDGADGPSYTPGPADVGTPLSVTVTGAADGYQSAEETSAPTAPVAPAIFNAAPTPTLSGAVRVGAAVTAVGGVWNPAATFTYRWRRDGAAITGATARTYRPVAGDRGHRLSVQVTGQRPGYASVSRTSAGAVVAPGAFTAAPVPTVIGAARVGATLTARPGTWSPAATVTYRWLRNGVAIAGATGATYRPTLADHTKRLTVRVTAARVGYATTSRTSATTAAVARSFVTVVRPTVTGTPRVGATLTARVGSWSPAATFSWQWRRNGVAIPGATAPTYRLVPADHQRTVTVTVTGKRAHFVAASRTSPATSRIAAPPPALTRDGSFRVGTEVAAGIYVSKPSDFCYWERRSYAGDDFDGIIANDLGHGQRIAHIAATDRYFTTDGCGTWTRLVPLAAPRVSVADGVFAVGEHLRPGLYQADGGDGCYWARLSGFSADLDDIVDNHFGDGQQYVRVYPGDAGFESSDCGTWSRIAN